MDTGINLTEIALVVVGALAGGLLFARVRYPAILGYILAGVFLGPSVFGLVDNREPVALLADLGVLMLLFLVGMELSIDAFKSVWRVALGCTVLLIACCGGMIWLLGSFFNFPSGLVVVLACAVALSSTAVAIKVLEGMDELHTPVGQLVVGVLIAQDLAVIPMIILLRDFATGGLSAWVWLKLLMAGGIIAGLVLYLENRRVSLPFAHLFSHQVELTAIAALTFCFSAAAVAGLIGLSAAYGAFLAGLIISNSHQQELILSTTRPIQSVLMMVFFLSVGLLIDFGYIWHHLGTVLLLLLFITIGKTAISIGILHLLRQPWPQAFLSGVILAQIGEFAFLLVALGDEVKLIDQEGRKLIVSLTVLSLALSPVWLVAARRLQELGPMAADSWRDIISAIYRNELAILGTGWRWLIGLRRKNSSPTELEDTQLKLPTPAKEGDTKK